VGAGMGYSDDLILKDDGLSTPEIGEWGQFKHRLLSNYASVFARSMKHKWDCRVYIDLFAGAGRARIEDTSRIVLTSPILAMKIPDPFDRYIFCELDGRQLSDLEKRVKIECPGITPTYLQGDSNVMVGEILERIPKPNASFTMLTFCFADPFRLENLRFSTIKALAQRLLVDFLILIPSGMDARRNWGLYLNPNNRAIDNFLGDQEWRSAWQSKHADTPPDIFLTDQYGERMRQLGYEYHGIQSTQEIRSTHKNLSLYRLAFFSRHNLGARFWREVKKVSKPQRELEFPE
jgi:three-Cys-motif partner protein